MLVITPRQNYIYWGESATFAVATVPKVRSAIEVQWQKYVIISFYEHEKNFHVLNISEKKYVGSVLLPSPKLVINDAEIEDNGTYRIQVRVSEGWCDSDWVSLEVKGSK